MSSNLNTFIAIGFVVFLIAITTILWFRMFLPLRKRIEEIQSFLYTLLKKDTIQTDSIYSIKKAVSVIHEDIGSLSTSTNRVINELDTVHNESIMPTPQLSNMIKETITEQITIETLLSHNMKIPNKKSTDYIIENVIRTYPNVDKEYIVKLSMAMIENFTLNERERNQEQK